jgi:hypothetical protein
MQDFEGFLCEFVEKGCIFADATRENSGAMVTLKQLLHPNVGY